jgi:hypothetical protein
VGASLLAKLLRLDVHQNQKPLTLTLSRRERGLIGGYFRFTPTWKCFIESIIDSVFQVDA